MASTYSLLHTSLWVACDAFDLLIQRLLCGYWSLSSMNGPVSLGICVPMSHLVPCRGAQPAALCGRAEGRWVKSDYRVVWPHSQAANSAVCPGPAQKECLLLVLGAKRLSSSQTCFLEGRAHSSDSLPDPETPRQFRGSAWSNRGERKRKVKEGRNMEKVLTAVLNGTGVSVVLWQRSLQNLAVEISDIFSMGFLFFSQLLTAYQDFITSWQLCLNFSFYHTFTETLKVRSN